MRAGTICAMRWLAAVALLLVACATPVVAGWRGADIHLVDGRWIGTETPCAAGPSGLECRTVVDQALASIPVDARRNIKAARAALPTQFVMATGEIRIPHLGGGLDSAQAVVLDPPDGTRRVVGLVCYLPYSETPLQLEVARVTCRTNPLDEWRDGNVPRSYPPGDTNG